MDNFRDVFHFVYFFLFPDPLNDIIYIYIYIVIYRQTVSLYYNSSVWLDK